MDHWPVQLLAEYAGVRGLEPEVERTRTILRAPRSGEKAVFLFAVDGYIHRIEITERRREYRKRNGKLTMRQRVPVLLLFATAAPSSNNVVLASRTQIGSASIRGQIHRLLNDFWVGRDVQGNPVYEARWLELIRSS
jgi:hypothetical protein